MSQTQAQLICIDCNLCCNGAIFPNVLIAPEEEERVGKFMNLVRKEGIGTVQRQGCHQLHPNGMCGCYHDRPQACRRFECDLLKRVEEGSVAFEDATKTVELAQRLHDIAFDAFKHACPNDQWDPNISGVSWASLTYMQTVKGESLSAMEENAAFFWVSYRQFMRNHFKSDYGDRVHGE